MHRFICKYYTTLYKGLHIHRFLKCRGKAPGYWRTRDNYMLIFLIRLWASWYKERVTCNISKHQESKNFHSGWGYSSMVEYMPSLMQGPAFMPALSIVEHSPPSVATHPTSAKDTTASSPRWLGLHSVAWLVSCKLQIGKILH